MARLIKAAGKIELRPPNDDHFAALVRSIMYQQLAGAAALAIHTRLVGLFKDGLTPAAVLALPEGAMRSVGVSGAKQAAIADLALKVTDGTVPFHDADSIGDDELVARLVQVRGIGRWTAEMFLMFQLRRPDVWPVDDYGVRKGMQRLYRLRELPKPHTMERIATPWRPYRSIASWYVWRAAEGS